MLSSLITRMVTVTPTIKKVRHPEFKSKRYEEHTKNAIHPISRIESNQPLTILGRGAILRDTA